MNLSKSIGELLYDHDCVIIPDFGGFVCNYSPAFIHTGKNRFRPPYKSISFNKNIRNNDGLLANKISLQENIPYSEANKRIAEEVLKFQYELEHKGRIEFKSIGAIYYGAENTLLFEQDTTTNYLPDSFGLTTFYSPLVKRETLERKVETQLKDRVVTLTATSKEADKSKRKRIRYISIAASVLLGGFLILSSLTTEVWQNNTIAALNPFAGNAAALYQPAPDDFPDDLLHENTTNLLAHFSQPADSTRYLNIMINGSIPIVVSLEQDKTAVVKTKQTKRGFQIIAGAFSLMKNAEKLVTKLRKLGYNAFIIDRKLHMVSYGTFATRKEALDAMDKIRATQQDIWLMTN